MPSPILLHPKDDAGDALIRRQLRLRREISTQRHAIRRAIAHGETRGTIARLQDALRQLELEMRDVTHGLRQAVA